MSLSISIGPLVSFDRRHSHPGHAHGLLSTIVALYLIIMGILGLMGMASMRL